VGYFRVGQPSVVVAHNDGLWTEIPPPPPSIRIDNVTITEGDIGTTPAVFTVTLSYAILEEVAVSYSTSTGQANDIVANSGWLYFAPG
jgi:hypothetical protein